MILKYNLQCHHVVIVGQFYFGPFYTVLMQPVLFLCVCLFVF